MTDLTFVRVKKNRHHLCVIVDVINRDIAFQRTERHKNAELIMQAISQIPIINLQSVVLFHSNRGKEFDNHFFMNF